jgi:hypothetical protein
MLAHRLGVCIDYGEVFWTDQGVTPLPADIIKRFDGKVMAIMGCASHPALGIVSRISRALLA